MRKCNFICKCNFKHDVYINEIFIGKRIPIKLLGKYKGEILFPILGQTADRVKLLSPQIDKLIPQTECGMVTKFIYAGREIWHLQINALYFCVNLSEDIKDTGRIDCITNEIERYVNNYIKCISLIHPSAICWSYINEENNIETIQSYFKKESLERDWCGCVSIDVKANSPTVELSNKEFWYIYKNITQDLTIQYELMSNVNRCYVRNEYREVILNCATIIEITLKKQISEYLDKICTVENVKKYILYSANAYDKIVNVMKNISIQVDCCKRVKESTIDIRNMVIHAGYFPKKIEAEKAIEDAKLIMKQYNVPLFVG